MIKNFNAGDMVTTIHSSIQYRVVCENRFHPKEVIVQFGENQMSIPKTMLRHVGTLDEEELHAKNVYGDAFDYGV